MVRGMNRTLIAVKLAHVVDASYTLRRTESFSVVCSVCETV